MEKLQSLTKKHNEETRLFLESLFEKCDGYIEFRVIPPRPKDNVSIENRLKIQTHFFPSLPEALDYARSPALKELNNKGYSIYVGVLPRCQEQGKEEDAKNLTTLWADIDFKDFESGETEAWEKVKAFPFKPTMIVKTGHGFHLYWHLLESQEITEENRGNIKGILKGIANVLNGDSVFDLSRVLRLPGFINRKPGLPPVNCEILDDSFDPSVRYELSDFDQYWVEPDKKMPSVVFGELPKAIPVRFSEILKQDKKLADTWNGVRRMPNDNSRSGYDMSLASQLVKYGFTPEEKAVILQSSPSGKGDQATLAYIASTVAKSQKKETERLTGIDEIKMRQQEYVAMLETIPVDTSKTVLTNMLEPFFRSISIEDPIFIRAILEEAVKSRFKLKAEMVDAFQEKINYLKGNEEDTDEGGKGDSKSKAALLMRLIEEQDIELFHTDLKMPFAKILLDSHYEIWPISGKQFQRWLRKIAWDAEKVIVSGEAIKNVGGILEAQALHEGKEYRLHNRVAYQGGDLWYDLCDEKWRAIKINVAGWEIVEQPPILFQRHTHQRPQVIPENGGMASDFLDFFNITNRDQQLAFLVAVIASLIPDFPHPMAVFYGNQGAAKTTSVRLMRSMIDPSKLGIIGFPYDPRELVQILDHNYFIPLDNLSSLSPSVLDSLCRAINGDGISKRELYTVDEDVIFSFQRCISLNGTKNIFSRPDLLDRSILIELERVSPHNRKDEAVFWEAFEAAKPKIFGAFLSILAKAMTIYKTVPRQNLPRMADFMVWGRAIAEAMGIPQEEFALAYWRVIDSQNGAALKEDPFVSAIASFIGKKKAWRGQAVELIKQITAIARAENIDTDNNLWPKAANHLSRRLQDTKSALAQLNIMYSKIARREISLRLESSSFSSSVGVDYASFVPRQKGEDVDDVDRDDEFEKPQSEGIA